MNLQIILHNMVFYTLLKEHIQRIAMKHDIDFSDSLLEQIIKIRFLTSIFSGQIPVIHGHSNAQLILFKIIKALSILSGKSNDRPLQKTMRVPSENELPFTIEEVMNKINRSNSP